MRINRLVLAVGLLACAAVPVVAGIWSNYPQVGVAAHCASTNQPGGPGTPTVCTTTVPAGPTAKTGLETVPADTNAAGGAAPQTVTLGLASLNALPITVQATIASGVNLISSTALQGGVVLTHTGTITSLNLTLPPSPIDDQQFALSSTQTVTTVLVNASTGDTVDSPPTVITRSTTAAYGYRFVYDLPTRKWYRLQ